MRFATLTLCFAALTAAAPSTYVFIETDNEIPLHEDLTHPRKIPEKIHLNYNDSIVADYHDKKLLANIRRYFGAFTDPDPAAMRDLQTEDFSISDMPLAYVNINREDFYQANKAFVSMIDGPRVTAISLDGSSAPGKFSIMECLVEFTLTMDPPPGPARNLPPGAKKGSYAAMIMLSTIWWTAEGKVAKELEYGRLIWQDFDLEPFFTGGTIHKPKNSYLGEKSGL